MSQDKIPSSSKDRVVHHIPKKKYMYHMRQKNIDQPEVTDEKLFCSPDSSVGSVKSTRSSIKMPSDDDTLDRRAEGAHLSGSTSSGTGSPDIDCSRRVLGHSQDKLVYGSIGKSPRGKHDAQSESRSPQGGFCHLIG